LDCCGRVKSRNIGLGCVCRGSARGEDEDEEEDEGELNGEGRSVADGESRRIRGFRVSAPRAAVEDTDNEEDETEEDEAELTGGGG
jgi:hypothetical protein